MTNEEKEYFDDLKESKSISIYKTLLSREELKAIYKKVEELGWN